LLLNKPTQEVNSTAIEVMSSSELRDLFDACKNGDLSKVKKLLTTQNVNEIGKPPTTMMTHNSDLNWDQIFFLLKK
jgi:hypothetical protein